MASFEPLDLVCAGFPKTGGDPFVWMDAAAGSTNLIPLSQMPFGRVIKMSESMSAPLEIWVAEDSPFYRLVVEEAIEEISKVTYLPISLTVFERFGDIRDAFEQAEQGHQALPAAVLSDLHFPDNAYDELQDIVSFYGRYLHLVPVSYMSCNPESLKTAQAFAESRLDAMQSARFLRKDTADTMSNLVKTIHAMIFSPRVQMLPMSASFV